jgi:hypothetical protein
MVSEERRQNAERAGGLKGEVQFASVTVLSGITNAFLLNRSGGSRGGGFASFEFRVEFK